MNQNLSFDFIKSAQRTVELEQQAIADLSTRLDENFVKACELILQCSGRVVVTGMGKSGHVGRKIAATLASTGTPAFFMHPAEAGHGDMGMVTANDLVIALSNSGTSSEIMTLLPLIKRMGAPLISMTGDTESPIARASDAALNLSVAQEACPLNLAPTSSTTAALVMGDAIAVALLEARGFTADDFAFSHPSGALGRKLLLKTSDLMHADTELPRVPADLPLKNALLEMTAKGLGITCVVDAQDSLLGVFTDGDLRRVIDQSLDVNQLQIGEVMNKTPTTISSESLAAQALGLMEDRKITALVVVGENNQAAGVIHMHDILRAGVV